MKSPKNKKGFTLLEILLVVAAIAILAGITIVAINPGKQLGETRNAQRYADVNTILNAVYQYYIDNGSLPDTINEAQTEICADEASDCTGLIDLSVLIVNQKYLTAIPSDPNGSCASYGACYEIFQTANGRVTVVAPDAEQGATISATK